MEEHKLQQRLDSMGATLTSYPRPPELCAMLESIDKQTVEIGLHAAAKCRKFTSLLSHSAKKCMCETSKQIYTMTCSVDWTAVATMR